MPQIIPFGMNGMGGMPGMAMGAMNPSAMGFPGMGMMPGFAAMPMGMMNPNQQKPNVKKDGKDDKDEPNSN
jgi:hypothetical protein